WMHCSRDGSPCWGRWSARPSSPPRRPPHIPEPPQPLHRQRRVLQRLGPVDERVELGVVDGRRAPELLADLRLLGGGVAPPLRLEVEHHLLADGEHGRKARRTLRHQNATRPPPPPPK